MTRTVAVISAAALAVAFIGLERVTRPPKTPSFASVRDGHASSDFVLEDSRGLLLSRVRRDFADRRSEWISIGVFPAEAREQLMWSEDRRFDSHGGVDGRALIAAAVTRVRGHGSRGGSTLTMQLAKRLQLSPKTSSLFGKIRQIRAARSLEATWTKNQILEAYVNLAPFRGELVGFPAAARAMFGKSVDRLSREEAALLIASLRGPNAIPEKIADRACGMLPSDCENLKTLSPRLIVKDSGAVEDRAPHLAQALAARGTASPFRSTLDRDLQIRVHETLASRLRGLRDRNVRDGAAMVVENTTGRVLASVGSAGPFSRSPFVDGTRALRQAGSTLKPFIYSLAFERKVLEPDSWIEDSAVDLVFPSGVYRPRNHDRVFHGWVRARTALASSLNVPAVKVLKLAGQDATWDRLTALGLALNPAEDYGPALALGVADLSMRQLVRAYLALANEGLYRDLSFDQNAAPAEPKRVIDETSARAVAAILSSPEDRALGFGFESGFALPFPAAVKTGTSKDMRDNWCFGWTKDYTIAVWVGNFDGEPMWDVSGLTGAAPAWAEIAEWLHERRRSQAADKKTLSRKDTPLAPSGFPGVKIEYPPAGLIVALDPEIPEKLQKIPLKASGPVAHLNWRIDGREIGAAEGTLWSPRRGRHKIELVEAGIPKDQVQILVR